MGQLAGFSGEIALPALAAAAGLALFLIAGLALLIGRGRRGADLRELAGRLAQLAEAQATAQARLGERLQHQEGVLAEVLERGAHRTQESLAAVRERLATVDAAQKTLTEMSGRIVDLQQILGNKQARGAFGEVQLETIVSGLLPPSTYAFQQVLGNGRRVDCLLRLPEPPGAIAIDAKFPLESWRAFHAAPDEATRIRAGKGFAADLARHVKDIAERYVVPGETADSAFLFLPSEAVYADLHALFPQVAEQAWRARVWIVSPTTLMATLHTVRAVLRDVRLRESASVLAAELARLADDVRRLDGRTQALGRHFAQAQEDLRLAQVSAERVARRAERLVRDGLGEGLSPAPAREDESASPPE